LKPAAAPPPIDRLRSPVWLWLLWAVWLFFLAQPIWTLVHAPPALPRLAAALAGLAVFVLVYLVLAWGNARRLTSRPAPLAPTLGDWAATSGLAALALLVTLSGNVNGTTLFEPLIFASAFAAGRLPVRWAILVVLALDILAMLAGLAGRVGGQAMVAALAFITVVGAAVIALVRAVDTEGELRAARVEIGRLAAEAERLRIARDLHDLLGHNLSLIALKSELAGRLVGPAPDRAATEIRDVEHVARGTLQQVREALAGYRQPALADELRGAQEILTAASITYQLEAETQVMANLSYALESLLAWTVREGVTNVIRHGRARRCTIHVVRDAARVQIEVVDDGSSHESSLLESDSPTQPGSGLRGLAERATALGGTCRAGPVPGGFSLTVSAPLEPVPAPT